MQKLILVIGLLLFCFILTNAQNLPCKCKPVPPDVSSQGANEYLEYPSVKVHKIQGQILSPSGTGGFENAIVEVFDFNSRKLQKSCMTDVEGRFCFSGLPQGVYWLRVGTKEGGLNYVHVKVFLVSKKKRASIRQLEYSLQPGT